MAWAAILPIVIEGFKAAAKLYSEVRSAMKQTGEWSEADEAEYIKQLTEAKTASHWRPDES